MPCVLFCPSEKQILGKNTGISMVVKEMESVLIIRYENRLLKETKDMSHLVLIILQKVLHLALSSVWL